MLCDWPGQTNSTSSKPSKNRNSGEKVDYPKYPRCVGLALVNVALVNVKVGLSVCIDR